MIHASLTLVAMAFASRSARRYLAVSRFPVYPRRFRADPVVTCSRELPGSSTPLEKTWLPLSRWREKGAVHRPSDGMHPSDPKGSQSLLWSGLRLWRHVQSHLRGRRRCLRRYASKTRVQSPDWRGLCRRWEPESAGRV